MIKRPMLAAKTPEDLSVLRYPLLGSYKLDGIRALVIGGVVYSRTLKRIPSKFVQEMWGHQAYNGLDGELIMGDPTHPNCYNRTYSAVMTHGSEEEVDFWVFDHFLHKDDPYYVREDLLRRTITSHSGTTLLHQNILRSTEDVLAMEKEALNAGFEGLILRDEKAPYKEGRSTLREQSLVKVKRTEDSEAIIIDFQELYRNFNIAETDALGYTKRSSHAENMIPAGTLGALICRTIPGGVEFKIGSGFDTALRDEIWRDRALWLGRVVTYKHLPYGVKEAPRHPIYKGLRGSAGKIDS